MKNSLELLARWKGLIDEVVYFGEGQGQPRKVGSRPG